MARITDKDINVRIISVLFAIVLWLYVASEQNPMEYKNVKDIPVELINVESVHKSGLVIKEGENYKVDITLQGKRNILSEMNVKDIFVEADLRGFTQKGVNTIPVEVKGVPANIELVDVTPKHIKVTFEQIITEEIPVKAITGGYAAKGYTALYPEVTPSQVLVRGPESLLSGVKVVTATLKLTGVQENVVEVLPVKVVDRDNNEVTGVEVSPDIVEVRVVVKKTKEVPVEVTMEGNPAEGKEITNISQNISSIIIYGKESVIQGIDKIKTQPVKVWGIEGDTYYDVDLILPDGVWTVDGVKMVSVFVDIESRITRKINMEKINFIGLSDGLEIAEGQDFPAVELTVEGKESIIEPLTTKDINVYCQLKELDIGKHTVSYQVKLPEGVELKGIEPQKINIELVSKDRGDNSGAQD